MVLEHFRNTVFIDSICRGIGLWNNRLWAIWFGVASGALFLPMEMYEVFEKLTIVRTVILLMNILLVFYLFRLSRQRTAKE